MAEIWKQIEEFPNYDVSNLGRIRKQYKNGKTIYVGCLGTHGYMQVNLSKNNKKKLFLLHKIVANAFITNTNNYPEVDHMDRNKLNNNVSNLRYATSTMQKLNTCRTRTDILETDQKKRNLIIKNISRDNIKQRDIENKTHNCKCCNLVFGYKQTLQKHNNTPTHKQTQQTYDFLSEIENSCIF